MTAGSIIQRTIMRHSSSFTESRMSVAITGDRLYMNKSFSGAVY